MVAAGFLDASYIKMDFWTEFPRKLSLAKAYLLKKKKTVNSYIYIFKNISKNQKIYAVLFFCKATKKTEKSVLTNQEESARVEQFLDALRENGVTYRMKNKKG